MNACFKQYRSIGNGVSIAGDALATYLGAPFSGKIIQEFGVKGMPLIMAGIMLNTVAITFLISRFNFDISEGPEEDQIKLALPVSKSEVDLQNKVIMEESPVIIGEEKDLLKVPVQHWSEGVPDAAGSRYGKTNVVECVAVIEHWRDVAESEEGSLDPGSRESQNEDNEDLTNPRNIAHIEESMRWRSFPKEDLENPLLCRRSWHNEDTAARRRKSLLRQWVSSSIESLGIVRQADNGYEKLEDADPTSSHKDTRISDTESSTVDTGWTATTGGDSGADVFGTFDDQVSSEKFATLSTNEGCVVQQTEVLNVLESLPIGQSTNEKAGQRQIPTIVMEGPENGLSRSNTELSLENGEMSSNTALMNDIEQLTLSVPGAPMKRRYSRLAQDILIRQLQDRHRRGRFGRHLDIFSNPTLYLLCVASSVMRNSVIIFLTRLAEVLQTKRISTMLEDKLLPTFCMGNLAACLCSGWFTDEGHISVRRAIAVDFFMMGASMLIVSLHNSVNTFAVQSLLQGWAYGQSAILVPVLLVKTLGVASCGLACGVVSFATGLSSLFGQLLVVSFRDSFGTQDFIFNFHGILALAIAGMFLVETRFNRALVNKRRPRAQEI